ncbi:Mbeg1-like protein [[Clostridium] polysaccharolyticum]|uniref:Mbeg1-like protein n=1 Tax=[Clostridium] polysaccharolyticum TaxID=29364 RepID=UPI0015A5278A|nr:Mbeg1-like protein [[Clostridium] polysaccharolyticum]
MRDEELLFLCNLLHWKDEKIVDKNGKVHPCPFYNAWTEENAKKGISIGELLDGVDTAQLRKNPVYSEFVFDGRIHGREWADMIDAMKPLKIRNLRLNKVSVDSLQALSTLFLDEDGEAYVAFHGTGGGEWEDNFEGGFVTETVQQKKALEFIESIPRDNLTVLGHSKGGNKAKYVTFLSAKVKRCISYDGQGFSQMFLEKYREQIEKNRHKITCYALDNDFVNVMLNDIYQTKKYIKGNGVDSFEQNHAANSFYSFQYNPDGTIAGFEFVETEQSAIMQSLHKFVSYVSAKTNPKEREKLFRFLGKSASMSLGKKPPEYIEKYTKEDMRKMLFTGDNIIQLLIFLCYMIEYEKNDETLRLTLKEILTRQYGKTVVGELFEKVEMIRDFWKIGTMKDCIEKIGKILVQPMEKEDYRKYVEDKNLPYLGETKSFLYRLAKEVSKEKPLDIKKWDIWCRLDKCFHPKKKEKENKLDGVDFPLENDMTEVLKSM